MEKERKNRMAKPPAEPAFLDEWGKCWEEWAEFLQRQWSPQEWVGLRLLLALGARCEAWNPPPVCPTWGWPPSGT
jgi:hypothetical protein